MDNITLKKRLSTYRTDGGHLKNVSNELLVDVLQAWESWSGPTSGFYSSIGVSHRQMASLMGKAKKLKREGVLPEKDFKEIKIEGSSGVDADDSKSGITMRWEKGRIIKFSKVDQLVDFLKKVA